MGSVTTVMSETASTVKPMAIKTFKFILLAGVAIGIIAVIGTLIVEADNRKKSKNIK